MSEKAEIKRDGGRAMKNSGRGMYQKGDYQLGIFTVDLKEYPKGYTLNLSNWAKICRDAYTNGDSQPALKVVLGSGGNKTRLAVISWDCFEDYLRLLEDERVRTTIDSV